MSNVIQFPTLKSISVDSEDLKNNLEVGRILKTEGYNNPSYVIIKNLGINQKFSHYGSKYKTIHLEEKTFCFKDAYTLRYLKDKVSGIQTYITDQILSIDETIEIYAEALVKRNIEKRQKEQAEKERLELIEKGKELFKKYIPESAKALIIAASEVDDSDLMTDYFNIKTVETVILGYSEHTKNIFSEMRKYAGKIPETEFLKEDKKEYEHREKYSMGKGYYLKGRKTTGWSIYKEKKYSDWNDSFYISIAKRCVFE